MTVASTFVVNFELLEMVCKGITSNFADAFYYYSNHAVCQNNIKENLPTDPFKMGTNSFSV